MCSLPGGSEAASLGEPTGPCIILLQRMPRPNSLAVKGHEYEELPSSRYQPRYGYQEMDDNSGSGSSGGLGRPLPPPMLTKLKSNLPEGQSNDSLCRPLSGASSNGGNDRISSTYRKRENPLYDEGEPDELELKPRKASDILCCPCSGFLIVAAVALVALILAILLFLGTPKQKQEVSFSPETAALVNKMNHSSLLAALAKMERIESQYYSLLQKFNQLNYSINQELTNMKEGMKASNGTTSYKIMRVETDFTDRLNRFDATLSSQIDDVSKMEGPQGARGPAGPAGAGNLTGCGFFPKRRGTAVSTTSTDTDWWPETLDDHQNWVMMGVECSTTGGTSSLLLTRTSSSSSISGAAQFSCTCEGNDGSSTSRFCILNIWRCPRIS